MTLNAFISLAWQTVVAPREVAQLLLATKLRGEALFLVLALVIVLNTIVFALVGQYAAANAESQVLPISPIVFGVALGLSVIGITAALTWTGRVFAGTATMADMAVLVAWLQALRLIVQTVVAVLTPVSPGLATLAVLFAAGAGIWILLNFVDVAHGFGNLATSGFVMILGVVSLIFALSVVLQFLGFSQTDLSPYV